MLLNLLIREFRQSVLRGSESHLFYRLNVISFVKQLLLSIFTDSKSFCRIKIYTYQLICICEVELTPKTKKIVKIKIFIIYLWNAILLFISNVIILEEETVMTSCGKKIFSSISYFLLNIVFTYFNKL